MENKIKRLWEYIQTKQLSKEEIANLTIIDGTCGNGTLGIFLLKLGVKEMIFNDIWKPSAIMTSINLKSNGFEIKKKDFNKNNIKQIAIGDKFEVYNLSFEELAKKLSQNQTDKLYKFDLCILDCFPATDSTNLEKIAKSLAKDVLII
jgi:ribosomal protein L11 methylase PrmA